MQTDKKSEENIVRAYVRYLKLERNYSPNTLEAYRHDLGHLLAYCHREQKDVLQIKLEDLQHFAAGIHELGIGPTSQARILSGVRSLYRFMLADHRIEQDPTELLESPQLGDHLPEVLSTDEVDRMEAAIDLTKWEGHRNRAIIEVLFSCGLRVSELVNLKWSQLFEEERYLRITGKGSKERLVPISDRALKEIANYLPWRRR